MHDQRTLDLGGGDIRNTSPFEAAAFIAGRCGGAIRALAEMRDGIVPVPEPDVMIALQTLAILEMAGL